MTDGELTLIEWRKKYPIKAKLLDAIGEHCIEIFKRNGYVFGCNGCLLKDKPKCHNSEMTIEELKENYKILFNKEFEE